MPVGEGGSYRQNRNSQRSGRTALPLSLAVAECLTGNRTRVEPWRNGDPLPLHDFLREVPWIIPASPFPVRAWSGRRSAQPDSRARCSASNLSSSSIRSRSGEPLARPFRRHSAHSRLRSDSSALRYRSATAHFLFRTLPERPRRIAAFAVFTTSSSLSLRQR